MENVMYVRNVNLDDLEDHVNELLAEGDWYISGSLIWDGDEYIQSMSTDLDEDEAEEEYDED